MLRRPCQHIADALLITKAQQGDRRAESELLARHERIVNHIARQYRIAAHDVDDLMQIGRLGLIAAIRAYNPDHGYALSTIAFPSVRSPLSHAYEYAARSRRGGNSADVSLDEFLAAEPGEGSTALLDFLVDAAPGPERTLIARDEWERMRGAIAARISHPLTGAVIDRLAGGERLVDIAREHEVSRSSLESLLRRIRDAATLPDAPTPAPPMPIIEPEPEPETAPVEIVETRPKSQFWTFTKPEPAPPKPEPKPKAPPKPRSKRKRPPKPPREPKPHPFGCIGVSYSAKLGKFRARTGIKKAQFYLGTFDTAEQAAAAVRAWREASVA